MGQYAFKRYNGLRLPFQKLLRLMHQKDFSHFKPLVDSCHPVLRKIYDGFSIPGGGRAFPAY